MAFKRKKFSGFKSNGDKNIMLDQVDLIEKVSTRDKVSCKLEEGDKVKPQEILKIIGQKWKELTDDEIDMITEWINNGGLNE